MDEEKQAQASFNINKEIAEFLTGMGCERLSKTCFKFNALKIDFYDGYNRWQIKLTDMMTIGRYDLSERFYDLKSTEELKYFLGPLIESQQGRDYSFLLDVADSLGGKYPSHARMYIDAGYNRMTFGKNNFLVRVHYQIFAGFRYVVIEQEKFSYRIPVSDKTKLSEMKDKIVKFVKKKDCSSFQE